MAHEWAMVHLMAMGREALLVMLLMDVLLMVLLLRLGYGRRLVMCRERCLLERKRCAFYRQRAVTEVM